MDDAHAVAVKEIVVAGDAAEGTIVVVDVHVAEMFVTPVVVACVAEVIAPDNVGRAHAVDNVVVPAVAHVGGNVACEVGDCKGGVAQ